MSFTYHTSAIAQSRCEAIQAPSLSSIPNNSELAESVEDGVFAAFEIDGDRIVSKFVREQTSGRVGLNMWRKFATRVPRALREDVTLFNVIRTGDTVNFEPVIDEETNERIVSISMAQFLGNSVGDVCGSLERRQFRFDWEMVRLVGQLYAKNARVPAQFDNRNIQLDEDQEPVLVDLFDAVFPRRDSDADLEESFPDDNSPKLNGRFVTLAALEGGLVSEVLDAFTTYMISPNLPSNRSRALATANFFGDIPEFADLKAVFSRDRRTLALPPLEVIASDELEFADDSGDFGEFAEFQEATNDFFLNFVRTDFRGSQVRDPGSRGSYSVKREVYRLGDTAIELNALESPVEGQGIIFYPDSIDPSISLPVILILHGRQETCIEIEFGGGMTEWPCRRGFRSVPNYQGFNYLANHLASQGFFVVSISANGITAQDETLPLGQDAQARAELIDKHLNMWRRFSQRRPSPLNGVVEANLQGRLDFTKVGLLGHSRGGTGIAAFVKQNANKSSARFGVRAVMPVAADNEARFVLSETSVAPVIAYCDGDDTDTVGVALFDDARYFSDNGDSRAFNFMYLMMGANHNYFNTLFTTDTFSTIGGDDWDSDRARARDPFCGSQSSNSGRFSDGEQRSALRYYASAYFNAMLKGRKQFDRMLPILVGNQAPLPSSRLSEGDVHESFHFPSSNRLDINRFTGPDDADINVFDGSANVFGVDASLCGFDQRASDACYEFPEETIDDLDLPTARFRQLPHERSYIGEAPQGVAQLLLRWSERGDYYETNFDPIDVRDYDLLNFRAAVQFDLHPVARDIQRLRVMLTDAGGNSTTVNVDNGEALFYPPGSRAERDNQILPRSILNTVKVSMTKFNRNNLDLRNIVSIRFIFNDQVANTSKGEGALLITDLGFSRL